MLRQIERFERPTSVEAAWRLLEDLAPAGRLLAGGTDLAGRCPPEVTTLIDLGRAGLRQVEVGVDGAVRIGAGTTFTDLLENPDLSTYGHGVVAETVVHVGSMLHRNSATVGGHVARGRLSDVIPTLLALDAEVIVHDGSEHVVALADYYRLGRNREPHVVVAVLLPPSPQGAGTAFERFARSAYDHALVNAACRVVLDGGRVVDARIVIGEIVTLGRSVPEAEEALVGRPAEPGVFAEVAATAAVRRDLVGDWMVTADHRRHVAEVLVRRALGRAAERARKGPS